MFGSISGGNTTHPISLLHSPVEYNIMYNIATSTVFMCGIIFEWKTTIYVGFYLFAKYTIMKDWGGLINIFII